MSEEQLHRAKVELLVITMEECGELIQACSKMLRFGSKNNKNSMQQEIADVLCMIDLLKKYGFVTEEQIEKGIKNKQEKLMKYSTLYSEEAQKC